MERCIPSRWHMDIDREQSLVCGHLGCQRLSKIGSDKLFVYIWQRNKEFRASALQPVYSLPTEVEVFSHRPLFFWSDSVTVSLRHCIFHETGLSEPFSLYSPHWLTLITFRGTILYPICNMASYLGDPALSSSILPKRLTKSLTSPSSTN